MCFVLCPNLRGTIEAVSFGGGYLDLKFPYAAPLTMTLPGIVSSSRFLLSGGRLAVDFTNTVNSTQGRAEALESWVELVRFLEAACVVSRERAAQLRALHESNPQATDRTVARALRLRDALRQAFAAISQNQKLSRDWIEPINEVLRVTEGHDELLLERSGWKLEFIAREESLDWLLAAIARSAAEIISEGAEAPLRKCSNPACDLFFYDTSRTRRRRWCSMALCGNRNKVASFVRRRHSSRSAAS